MFMKPNGAPMIDRHYLFLDLWLRLSGIIYLSAAAAAAALLLPRPTTSCSGRCNQTSCHSITVSPCTCSIVS